MLALPLFWCSWFASCGSRTARAAVPVISVRTGGAHVYTLITPPQRLTNPTRICRLRTCQRLWWPRVRRPGTCLRLWWPRVHHLRMCRLQTTRTSIPHYMQPRLPGWRRCQLVAWTVGVRGDPSVGRWCRLDSRLRQDRTAHPKRRPRHSCLSQTSKRMPGRSLTIGDGDCRSRGHSGRHLHSQCLRNHNIHHRRHHLSRSRHH